MLVVGDREVENQQVALRLRNGENQRPVALSAFIERAREEVEKKI